MRRNTKFLYILMSVMLFSCGKKYLDLQQEKNLRVPKTLEDFQKLLNQVAIFNESSAVSFANVGADDYYIPAAQYNTVAGAVPPVSQRNAYIWADDIYIGKETELDWNKGYATLYQDNLVLEFTENHPRSSENADAWDKLKGTALFVRANVLFNLAQVYVPVYSKENAQLPLGLPLRKDPDPTVKVPRSSVEETYQEILNSLSQAESLLKDQAETVFDPSKAAVYALESRVYMQMGDYTKAELAADRCLALNDELLDYNSLALTNTNKVSFGLNGAGNPEVIYMATSFFTQLFNWYHADTTLLKSYDSGDIRYGAYYYNPDSTVSIANVTFKGSYKGSTLTTYFCGLATDEVLLNRAESRARNNKLSGALEDLNYLRKHRYTQEAYEPLESSDQDEVMSWILSERRKELVMRGTRWADLRRLNKESKYATTLVRDLENEHYELKPESDKWVWPLPIEAISNGGYTQNPR